MIKYEAACQQSEIQVNFIDKWISKPVRAEHRIAGAGEGAWLQKLKNISFWGLVLKFVY